jgi:hypothetical protein
MRNLAAAIGALAVAGCAASSPPGALAPAGALPTVPHPIVAEATPAPPETSHAETNPQEEHGEAHSSRQMNRVWGWVALSVGAEGAALATITSLMMLHQNSVRSADCTDKVCSPDGIAANGKIGDLAGWNAAGWAVAVVGVGVGAFLILTNPSDAALGTQVGLGPTASGSGLLLRGSF